MSLPNEPWTTSYPAQQDTVGVEQKNLVNESFEGAGDGHNVLAEHLLALRDKCQALAEYVGDSMNLPGTSLRKRVTDLEAAMAGWTLADAYGAGSPGAQIINEDVTRQGILIRTWETIGGIEVGFAVQDHDGAATYLAVKGDGNVYARGSVIFDALAGVTHNIRGADALVGDTAGTNISVQAGASFGAGRGGDCGSNAGNGGTTGRGGDNTSFAGNGGAVSGRGGDLTRFAGGAQPGSRGGDVCEYAGTGGQAGGIFYCAGEAWDAGQTGGTLDLWGGTGTLFGGPVTLWGGTGDTGGSIDICGGWGDTVGGSVSVSGGTGPVFGDVLLAGPGGKVGIHEANPDGLLHVSQASPYAFEILERTDQPAFPAVQIDVDSGAFVLSPQTGAGWLDKHISIEGAKLLPATGTQDFDWSLGYNGFTNKDADIFRFMQVGTGAYLKLAAGSLELTGDGDATFGIVMRRVLRLRQYGADRYRSDMQATSGGLEVNAYDDTGLVYLPVIYNGSTWQFNPAGSTTNRVGIDASGNLYLPASSTGGFLNYSTVDSFFAGKLAVGSTGAPSTRLHVVEDAVATSVVTGLLVENTTLATAPAPRQYSPAFAQRGTAWNGAASSTVEFYRQVWAEPGAGSVSGALAWGRTLGGVDQLDLMWLSSGGGLTFNYGTDAFVTVYENTVDPESENGWALSLSGGAAFAGMNGDGGPVYVSGGAKSGAGHVGYVLLNAAGGYVGVNTLTPLETLHVVGNILLPSVGGPPPNDLTQHDAYKLRQQCYAWNGGSPVLKTLTFELYNLPGYNYTYASYKIDGNFVWYMQYENTTHAVNACFIGGMSVGLGWGSGYLTVNNNGILFPGCMVMSTNVSTQSFIIECAKDSEGMYFDVDSTFYIKAVAAQTKNIQEWRNSANAVLASVGALGGIFTSSLAVKTHAAFTGSGAIESTAAVQTTDGTETTLSAVTLTNTYCYTLTVTVTARSTAGTERGTWVLVIPCHREGGGAVISNGGGAHLAFADTDNPATWTVTADTSGNDVRVRVTGAVGKTINWVADVTRQAVSGAA